jgi:hypothetical protein
MSVEHRRTVAMPDLTMPDDQAWFWTRGWQAGEREADEALNAGERGEISYDTVSFLASLAEDEDSP